MKDIGWCLHGDGDLSVWQGGDTDNATEIQITKAVAYLARHEGVEDIYQLRGVLTACIAILDDALEIAPNVLANKQPGSTAAILYLAAVVEMTEPSNAKVSGAGTASAGLPG